MKKPPSESMLRRSAARLAAVQATYQIVLTGANPHDVAGDFLSGAIGGEAIEEDPDLETEKTTPLIDLDARLFAILTRGVEEMKERLDGIIDVSLGGGWDAGRLQPLARAVLRCGLYELLERPATPARACICEYVDIARSFFGGGEPDMVNAVLDRLARQARAEEMERPRKTFEDRLKRLAAGASDARGD